MSLALSHLSPWGLVLAVLAGWVILAALGLAGWSFAVGRVKRRLANRVRRPSYPPPVPAPLPRASDASWLFDLPDEVWLTDPVVRDRCRQIEIAEGWAA